MHARLGLPARAHLVGGLLHTAPVEPHGVVLVSPVGERQLGVAWVGDGGRAALPRDVLATDKRHRHEDVHLVERHVVFEVLVDAVGEVTARQVHRLLVVVH